MAEINGRILELALIGLEAERRRIEADLQQLRGRLRGWTADSSSSPVIRTIDVKPRRTSPNKGIKMSEEQKRKISATMKARWSLKRRKRRV